MSLPADHADAGCSGLWSSALACVAALLGADLVEAGVILERNAMAMAAAAAGVLPEQQGQGAAKYAA